MNLNTIKIEITNLKIDIIKCSLLLYPSGLLSSIISDRYGRLKFTRDHLSFQESFTRKRKFVSHFDCGPKVQTPLTKNPARSSMTLSPMGTLNSNRNLIDETIKVVHHNVNNLNSILETQVLGVTNAGRLNGNFIEVPQKVSNTVSKPSFQINMIFKNIPKMYEKFSWLTITISSQRFKSLIIADFAPLI